MSLLGKILRSSTAQDTSIDSNKSAKDALKEFRPASVGVIPAESADFVSLEGQAYDGDLFHREGMIQGGSDPNLHANKDEDHPSSPQQQQQQEKVKGTNEDGKKSKGGGGSSKTQFSWEDFTTAVLINKGDKERPTSRKLYLGSAGTTASKAESTSATSAGADAHSDVRITYIGGTDRPGTSADRDDNILKKKSIVNRPTRSAGARPSPIRTSKFDYDNIRGAPYLQRMSSFGGFEGLPEYLTEQYPTTYGDDDQQRPPSRQGSAFPMNMDSEDSPVKPVDLADLDSDDDILKVERSPARTAKGIRSAPGKKAQTSSSRDGVVTPADTNRKIYNAAEDKMRVGLSTSHLHSKKPRGSSAKKTKEEATTSVRAWSASKNGTRGVNNPVTDGFTELGDASSIGEMLPFKIHVNTGSGNKSKGKVKGRKKSLRKLKNDASSLLAGSSNTDGGLLNGGSNKPIVKDTTTTATTTTKQRPTLEITGIGGSSLNEKLLRSKKTVESEQLDDLDDDFIVIDDGDGDDEEDGDEDDDGEDGENDNDDDDEGEYSYKNEGNLAITELETNLDMDFLSLFAGPGTNRM